LSGNKLAGDRVDDSQAIGVADKYLLTSPVLLTHAVVELITPTAIILTELSILVAVGVLLLVLQP